ncbi:MAG: CoA pyrophosphatase, partial [Flavobacterium sp.]
MNFTDFYKAVQAIESIDLPAISAHVKMAPIERIQMIKDGIDNFTNAREAAVMMLIYPKESIAHLALIVRNSYPGIHSSQIAFPGGKVEVVDVNLKETALRETYEEIGIPPDLISVIKDFSSVYIPPSNFLVYPFLGISSSELEFTLQTEEVAGIIELPLSLLLDDSIITTKSLETSYAKSIEVPVFEIGEHLVWGATAMMLSELKDSLK